MTAEEFKAAHPLERELTERGHKLIGQGRQPMMLCPFHGEKTPSMSVNLDKQLWHCFGCGSGGSVIDLLMKLDGKTAAQVLANGEAPRVARRYGETGPVKVVIPKVVPAAPPVPDAPLVPRKEVCRYQYRDRNGEDAFMVVRFEPKTFQQWKSDRQRNMDGVERVLYRLPEVLLSEQVWVTEGEKDADTLVKMGWCGTTNCGGAGKWLDSYSLDLAGREVVICGDNDLGGKTTGADHIDAVFKSVKAGAKNVRKIKIPLPHKDVTEFVESFTDREEARKALNSLLLSATVYVKGHDLPLFSLADLEAGYIDYAENTATRALDLSVWLPSLKDQVRPLMPGELVTLIADTGTGKTALMQNLAVQGCANVPTLFFELELPPELMFERFVAIRKKVDAKFIEEGYRRGDKMGREMVSLMCQKLRICTRARITPEWLEETINRSELMLGERPLVVIVDYLGLMRGEGRSRYEQFSNIVEELRIIAKTTRTIIIATSQVTRDKKRATPEITMHDAKESGSIENSSSLVLGSWRDAEDDTCLHLRVLKNTKGKTGWNVQCDFDGPTMRITERSGGWPDKDGKKPTISGKLSKIEPGDENWTSRMG